MSEPLLEEFNVFQENLRELLVPDVPAVVEID